MNWYKAEQKQEDVKQFQHFLVEKYPGLDLELWDNGNHIELAVLELPKNMRDQGYGTSIVKEIQNFATQRGLPIVIRPLAERGKKEALERFYQNLGFVHNRGRHASYYCR